MNWSPVLGRVGIWMQGVGGQWNKMARRGKGSREGKVETYDYGQLNLSHHHILVQNTPLSVW